MLVITSRNAKLYQPGLPVAPPMPLGIPFNTAEEAWFWFICWVEARQEGATYTRNHRAEVPRPCEPMDILRILERLHRNRRLLWAHLKVLNHYGRRRCAPEEQRLKERDATKLWREAMKELDVVLQRRGIVRDVFQREMKKMRGVETL